MNRLVRQVCRILDEGASLKDVREILDPFERYPNLDRHDNPVCREAWHVALEKAKKPRQKRPVPISKPKTSERKRVKRTTRAQRRNFIHERKDAGNTKPHERQVIHEMIRTMRAERERKTA